MDSRQTWLCPQRGHVLCFQTGNVFCLQTRPWVEGPSSVAKRGGTIVGMVLVGLDTRPRSTCEAGSPLKIKKFIPFSCTCRTYLVLLSALPLSFLPFLPWLHSCRFCPWLYLVSISLPFWSFWIPFVSVVEHASRSSVHQTLQSTVIREKKKGKIKSRHDNSLGSVWCRTP